MRQPTFGALLAVAALAISAPAMAATQIDKAEVQSGQVTVTGSFGVAKPAIVTLGGVSLPVLVTQAGQVVAAAPPTLASGDYRLSVESFSTPSKSTVAT